MTVLRDFDIKPQGAACEIDLKLWYGPRKEPGKVLMEENRTVEISAPDDKGGYRLVSTHVFTAREEVKIDGRRPESYGGFSCRMADIVRGFNVTAEGGTPNATKNTAGPKEMTSVTYTDPKSGHGITIRELTPLPTEQIYTWADHRFANPVPMYAAPVTLKAGEKLTLKYEVTVF